MAGVFSSYNGLSYPSWNSRGENLAGKLFLQENSQTIPHMHKQFSNDMLFNERCVFAALGNQGQFLTDHLDRYSYYFKRTEKEKKKRFFGGLPDCALNAANFVAN